MKRAFFSAPTACLLLYGLLLGLPAQATEVSAGDDLERLLADKGLLAVWPQVVRPFSQTASELAVSAMAFIGVPYRRGGNSADSGFDCSGFVRSVYQQGLGLLLPRRAEDQAAATQVINPGELQAGDLVFFNTMRRAFSHVGIYVGNGKFIHSPKPGAGVRIEDMGLRYWSQRFNGARRVNVGANSNRSLSDQP